MEWVYLVAEGVLTVLFTLALGYFGFVVRVESRLARIEASTDVFWKVLNPHLASIIHSPQHTRRDELVDRMINGRLTKDELVELSKLLEECVNNCDSDGKRIAASLLLARANALLAKEKKKWL